MEVPNLTPEANEALKTIQAHHMRIVNGTVVISEPNSFSYTLAHRGNVIGRYASNRFAGKRVRQSSTKRNSILARQRRLTAYGWPITAFAS